MTTPSRGNSYFKTKWGEGQKWWGWKRSSGDLESQPLLWGTWCLFGWRRPVTDFTVDFYGISLPLVMLLFSLLCKCMVGVLASKAWVQLRTGLIFSFSPQFSHANTQLGWILAELQSSLEASCPAVSAVSPAGLLYLWFWWSRCIYLPMSLPCYLVKI